MSDTQPLVEDQESNNHSEETKKKDKKKRTLRVELSEPQQSTVDPNDHCHTDLNYHTQSSNARKKILIACFLVLVFMVAEFIGGYIANSLAIMTDAFHLLSDFAGFLISLLAIWMGARPATKNMSFGYYRAEVIGAVISVLLIWVLTGVLIYMAILRLINSEYEIDADIMLIAAGVGVFINIVLGVVLFQADIPHDVGGFGHNHGSHSPSHTHQSPSKSCKEEESVNFYDVEGAYQNQVAPGKEAGDNRANNSSYEDSEQTDHGKMAGKNINVRAAFIHCVGDLIQSTGIVLAALIIKFRPDWKIADPICTFFFSIIVLITTLTILRDAVLILMEGKPAEYEYDVIMEEIRNTPSVVSVHNLHMWSLSIDKVALAVHITIEPETNQEKILLKVTKKLKSRFQFSHTTIQVEHYRPHLMDDCKQCLGPDQ